MREPIRLVLMGVAGCGKSYVGERVAAALGLPLIEGDDFHPPGNRAKMARGEPLTDADRAGWLHLLGEQLREARGGAVLTCSALKKSYRDTLRAAASGVGFVHLAITPQESGRRVAARKHHFYPASLVASQFEALEDPAGEPRVLVVDGTAPLDALTREITAWVAAMWSGQTPP